MKPRDFLKPTATVYEDGAAVAVDSQRETTERRAMKNHAFKSAVAVFVMLLAIAVCSAVAQAQSSTGT